MGDRRIAITGIGVLSSNGIGKDAFGSAIFNGISGIKPISLFDTEPFKVKTAGEIKDFQPKDILGEKGLRTLDRSTRLINCAAKLAIDDAGINITEENSQGIGIVAGDTLGSISSISDFDKEALKEGVRFVNPALFPNTVINSPASQVSIRFNIKGFNTTISTGFTAGLDAIGYGADFIRLGRAKFVLAGGVEELCIQTFLGFYKTGLLAGLKNNGPEISCPFDRRRSGIVLGEASSLLVLEDLDSALRRGARVYAEVKGFGTGFNKQYAGLKKAIDLALKKSQLSPGEIGYICSGANSTKKGDYLESLAIREVFNGETKKIPISSIKSMVGECYSASGALAAAAACLAMEKQTIPPNINYEEKDPAFGFLNIVNEPKNHKINNALINAFGPSGRNSSLVISKFFS